jgi:hypothetical protein
MPKKKQTDALAWVKKAVVKRDREWRYPGLVAPRVLGGKTFASDSFRLHIVHAHAPLCEDARALPAPPNYSTVLAQARELPTVGAITRDDLAQAVKAATAIKPWDKGVVLWVNGALDVRAENPAEDGGDIAAHIQHGEKIVARWLGGKQRGCVERETFYIHTGPDASIKVNAKYLLDALAGMPDVVGFRLRQETPEDDSPMLYLGGVVDGVEREAVIMGMERDELTGKQKPEEKENDDGNDHQNQNG